MKDRVRQALHGATFLLGVLSVVLLVILSVLGLAVFLREVRDGFASGLNLPVLLQLLDTVLLIFIVIELLSIALALAEERRVIIRVFEAVLVAIARKIIVSGTSPIELDKAASLALITLTVGVTWRLVLNAEKEPNEAQTPRGR